MFLVAMPLVTSSILVPSSEFTHPFDFFDHSSLAVCFLGRTQEASVPGRLGKHEGCSMVRLPPKTCTCSGRFTSKDLVLFCYKLQLEPCSSPSRSPSCSSAESCNPEHVAGMVTGALMHMGLSQLHYLMEAFVATAQQGKARCRCAKSNRGNEVEACSH